MFVTVIKIVKDIDPKVAVKVTMEVVKAAGTITLIILSKKK